ncbi:hypothetical protein BVRB_7g169450 [Beta vulgaris subsp. vulgaris]|nr:hypothetical protein BVRB_7g169450 [Beta vulgaris subsp. vulgaris]
MDVDKIWCPSCCQFQPIRIEDLHIPSKNNNKKTLIIRYCLKSCDWCGKVIDSIKRSNKPNFVDNAEEGLSQLLPGIFVETEQTENAISQDMTPISPKKMLN